MQDAAAQSKSKRAKGKAEPAVPQARSVSHPELKSAGLSIVAYACMTNACFQCLHLKQFRTVLLVAGTKVSNVSAG